MKTPVMSYALEASLSKKDILAATCKNILLVLPPREDERKYVKVIMDVVSSITHDGFVVPQVILDQGNVRLLWMHGERDLHIVFGEEETQVWAMLFAEEFFSYDYLGEKMPSWVVEECVSFLSTLAADRDIDYYHDM